MFLKELFGIVLFFLLIFFFFGSVNRLPVNRFSESKIEYPVCISEAGNG